MYLQLFKTLTNICCLHKQGRGVAKCLSRYICLLKRGMGESQKISNILSTYVVYGCLLIYWDVRRTCWVYEIQSKCVIWSLRMRSRQDVATVVTTLYHLLVMASTTVANHPDDHIQLGDHQYSSQFLTYVDQVLLDLGKRILFIKPSIKKSYHTKNSNF